MFDGMGLIVIVSQDAILFKLGSRLHFCGRRRWPKRESRSNRAPTIQPGAMYEASKVPTAGRTTPGPL